MDEFPNSDEEFELMHQEEFELLREHDDYFKVTSAPRKQLPFCNVKKPTLPSDRPTVLENVDNSFEADFSVLPSSQENQESSNNFDDVTIISEEHPEIESTINNQSNKKKRSLDKVDITTDDNPLSKRNKVDVDFENTILINQILHLRQQAKKRLHTLSVLDTNSNNEKIKIFDKCNLSYRVPKYPFVALTRTDGERIYIRCHSEEYEKEELKRITSQEINYRLLGDSSKNLWKEANEIINRMVDNELEKESENNHVLQTSVNNISILHDSTESNNNSQLWVDLYKPKTYFQLLSDEGTNRSLLKWLKMWDKIVFNKSVAKQKKPIDLHKNQRFERHDVELDFDEFGRPEKKIALLCGPPGLGKTTLAHVVAKQAGYNVVEVNASDDRSADCFKTILKNATEMRSFIDKENRPNCVIFDEIDGAPQSSIDYLVKFTTGNARNKSKKGINQKQSFLKRPIICICNDVYVPALKPLRKISFVVNFSQTASSRLAERLYEISKQQGIITDIGALLALSEKCNNDIRSCLCILHFFKSLSKRITLSDICKTSIGQKDMQKGLFSVWQDIFQIERNKQNAFYTDSKNLKTSSEVQDSFNVKNRTNKVLKTVGSFGNYERLAQGVFENFPKMNVKDSTLIETSEALSWFSYFDVVNTKIRTLQEYSLAKYLPYAFVVWHFVFGSFARPQLVYPNKDYEARLKRNKVAAIIGEVLKDMQPSIRTHVHVNSLLLDIVPLLVYIIVPYLRSVNLQLYTDKEKEQLQHLVNIMIDYNLTYAQERHPDGSYSFELDPNINEVAFFSTGKPLRTFTYLNKQIITKEIEMEKIRSSNLGKLRTNPNKTENQEKSKFAKKETQNLPNHLQRLKPKMKSPKEMVRKDFFGRIITSPASTNNETIQKQNDIWFQYKEGYSNAVRKPIKVSSLK